MTDAQVIAIIAALIREINGEVDISEAVHAATLYLQQAKITQERLKLE